MEKPSRFVTQKRHESNYEMETFYKIKLSERFYFSQAIHRIQKWTIHNGVDLKTKDEVIIVSAAAKQRNIQNEYKKISDVCSKLLFEGERAINKVKYRLKVYKKSGCMLEEFLSYLGNVSMKTLQLVSLLLIELIIKIHKMNANIKCFDERALHIVIDPLDDFLKVQICHPNLIQFRVQKKSVRKSISNRALDNQSLIQQLSPNRKMSFFLQKINIKPSYQRDIQILYQKILQISIKSKQFSLTSSKKQDIFTQIKILLKKVIKLIQNKEKPSTWIKSLSEFVNAKLSNFLEQRIEVKQIIHKIKNKNFQKSSSLCNLLMTKKVIQENDVSDLSQSDTQSINENEVHNYQQIQANIINHTLITHLQRQLESNK